MQSVFGGTGNVTSTHCVTYRMCVRDHEFDLNLSSCMDWRSSLDMTYVLPVHSGCFIEI